MNDLPLIDSAQMDRLTEWGGRELQTKMVDLFLTHAKDRMDQIREGLSSSEAETAETGAHTLKSSAGTWGPKGSSDLLRRQKPWQRKGIWTISEPSFPTWRGNSTKPVSP